MKNKERLARILGACEEAQKHGWKIVDHYISREKMECDPLGAIILTSGELHVPTPAFEGTIRQRLECDHSWLNGFIKGWRKEKLKSFDDDCIGQEDRRTRKKAYRIGRRIRKQFKDVKVANV